MKRAVQPKLLKRLQYVEYFKEQCSSNCPFLHEGPERLGLCALFGWGLETTPVFCKRCRECLEEFGPKK